MPKKHQISALKLKRFLLLKSRSQKLRVSAKSEWWVVKPNTTSTSPMEPQNSSNSSYIACKSEMKQGKTYNKKAEEKRKEASGEEFGCYDTDYNDHESFDYFSGQTKTSKNPQILYCLQQTSHKSADDMKSFLVSKEEKPRK